MMTRVIENKLRSAGDLNTRLIDTSAKEGETIGRGLAMSMATNLTAEAGVEEFIMKYRSLRELDKK